MLVWWLFWVSQPTHTFSDSLLIRTEKNLPTTQVTKGRAQLTAHILHLKCTVKLMDFEIIDSSLAPLMAPARKKVGGSGNNADDDDSSSVLRPGQRATATFSFPAGPQYVRSGMRIIFRDGHVRGFGKITEVVGGGK